jgi:CubicO group peptidase (beta-lactamase class C family)
VGADVNVDGFVAHGFEAVEREFRRNFTERHELGASFAAVSDGEIVVDLWGGTADRSSHRPWSEDTLQLIFSGTKGLVAMCLLILIERGELQLEAEVSRYWPEFSAAGKGGVTVRQVVSHAARLPGLSKDVGVAELADDERMAALLAAQAQLQDSRASRTYHALTYGWLCGELVRRIDGRSVGRFFAEEIAAPLNAEVFIGLPEALEPRVSRLELGANWDSTMFDQATAAADDLARAVWRNPIIWTAASFPWNDRLYHAAEIPAANAIGTARAIAGVYANLDQVVSRETVELGRTELERRDEPLLGEPQSFGIGFELQTDFRPFGPAEDGFGHTGAGGSTHGAWPSRRVGFSYAMNMMRNDQEGGDPRAKALLGALYDCLPR